MGLRGVRDPSAGLDRAASLESGAALEVEKVREVRALGRVRLGRGDHLAREDLEGGGGGGVGVVQRDVEEVVGQLEAAHAEHVAHAVGGGGGHGGLATRGRVEGMEEGGRVGLAGRRRGARGNRAPASACVPVGGRRRGECLRRVEGAANRGATTRGVGRARRAAWRTCGAARSGPRTARASGVSFNNSTSDTQLVGPERHLAGLCPTAPFDRPTSPSEPHQRRSSGLTSVFRFDRGGSRAGSLRRAAPSDATPRTRALVVLVGERLLSAFAHGRSTLEALRQRAGPFRSRASSYRSRPPASWTSHHGTRR